MQWAARAAVPRRRERRLRALPGVSMIYRFEGFELDADARLLCREGQALEVPKRVFDCLHCLLERHPCAVDRDSLIRAVWGRDNVSDNQLAQIILKARRLLGEEGAAAQLIRTVPGFGYHFVATVQRVQSDTPEEAAPTTAADAAQPFVALAERSAARRSPWPRALAAGLLAALVLGLLLGLRQFMPEPYPPQQGVAVLPAQIEDAERAGWARHGLMAVVAARLAEAGVQPLELERVMARLPREGAAALDAGQLRQRLDGRDPLQIRALRGQDPETWEVRLQLAGEPPREVRARHADLIEAAQRASDALLTELGHAAPVFEEPAPLALARRALRRHDFHGARMAMARLSPALAASTEVRLLAIELELAAGYLERAGQAIELLASQLQPEPQPLEAAQLELLRAQWRRASGQPEPAEPLQALVEQLERLEAPPVLLGRALQARGGQALGSGRSEEAALDFARAHRLYLSAGDSARAASANSNLAMMALLQGRHVEAVEKLRASAAVFRDEGDVGRLFNALSSIDALQVGLLRWQEALATSDDVAALLPLVTDASARQTFYRRRALIVLGLGRVDEAEALLASAEREGERGEPNPHSQVRQGLYAAQVALARGDGEATYRLALPVFEQVYARFGDEPGPVVRTDSRDIALLLMVQGRHLQWRQAKQLHPLPDEALAVLVRAQSALALVARGRWHGLHGDARAAEDDLRAGLQSAEGFNRLSRILTASEALIELLLEQGRGAEAEAVFLALLARESDLPERDFDAAVLDLRLQLAAGQDEASQRAWARVRQLAGQRPLPADLWSPSLRIGHAAEGGH